ncbi:MAG: P1 family peptidase [Actinomycetota bacterium]
MGRGSLGFGFKIGHSTNDDARTGCTVVLPPLGNVSSCEIRGSSPGTREVEQLHPDRRLTEIHGLVLTGGSAFGLAVADGVQAWLEEKGIGYQTAVGVVPIVPAAVIFDLSVGDAAVRPRAEQGRAACDTAIEGAVSTGRVGAGTGATVGKWAGRPYASPGGLGIARVDAEGTRVSALAVVNSVGDVIDGEGNVVAGTRADHPRFQPPGPPDAEIPTNTVLGVIAVKATLDKREVRWLAARGADGITVSVVPAHTRYDGDVVFAIAAPADGDTPPSNLDIMGALATEAMAAAVRNAVAPETASNAPA